MTVTVEVGPGVVSGRQGRADGHGDERYGLGLSVPERSLVQRMEALDRANWIRSRRKLLKLDLAAGRVSVLDLLDDPPEYAETMKLYDLLLAVPKLGRVKVNKVLSQCRISPSKTLGGASERQRGEVLGLLRRRWS